MAVASRPHLAWLAVVAATAAAGLGVVRISDAALRPVHASVWSGGEVVLAGEPVAAGMFEVEGMLPGRTEVRCVTVRWTGTVEGATVRLYATGVTGGLAPYLDVRVETAPACDAFPAHTVAFAGTLADMPATWKGTAASWVPAPGERRAYRFTVTLRDDDRARDLSASAEFVWEAR